MVAHHGLRSKGMPRMYRSAACIQGVVLPSPSRSSCGRWMAMADATASRCCACGPHGFRPPYISNWARPAPTYLVDICNQSSQPLAACLGGLDPVRRHLAKTVKDIVPSVLNGERCAASRTRDRRLCSERCGRHLRPGLSLGGRKIGPSEWGSSLRVVSKSCGQDAMELLARAAHGNVRPLAGDLG